MNKELYIERILETENLTGDLEDANANWFLDWGIARLDRVLQGAEDTEAAGSRVNELMAVMRKINRIVGSYPDKSPQRLAGDLAELRELFVTAFGEPGASPAAPTEPETPHPSAEPLTSPEASQASEEDQPSQDDLPSEASQASEEAQPEQEGSIPEAPEASAPTSPDFSATAIHLARLSPTEVLYFLAQDFYPVG